MALKEIITVSPLREEQPSVREVSLQPYIDTSQYYFNGEASVANTPIETPLLQLDVVDHDTIRVTAERKDGRVIHTIFSREQINQAAIRGKSGTNDTIHVVWFDPYTQT
jgi:hypothetical protein